MKHATITIRFAVNEDGTLNSVTMEKDVPPECDNDVKTGIHSIFQWITGKFAESFG